MSITYEEALETLQNMFGEPWTRTTLDAVLRHYKGHMENTVESILKHGESTPDELVKKLKTGGERDEQAELDQQLARSLAAQEGNEKSKQLKDAPQASKKGRGTPTDLPPDFLRIPGYKGSGQSRPSTIDQDEALARMLQDELFSQELANNPEFAHLARGRPNPSVAARQPVQRGSSAHFSEPPKIMENVSKMGQEAKKKLQFLAEAWNTQWHNNAYKFGIGNKNDTMPTGSAVVGTNETRGLLDDDDDDGEMMEMTFAGSNAAGKKTQ